MRDALGLPSLVVDLWILKSHARVLLHHGHGGREHRVPGRHGRADALLVLAASRSIRVGVEVNPRQERRRRITAVKYWSDVLDICWLLVCVSLSQLLARLIGWSSLPVTRDL